MKTLIFIFGDDSLKSTFAEKIIDILNPSVSEVDVLMVAIGSSVDSKAEYNHAKNIAKNKFKSSILSQAMHFIVLDVMNARGDGWCSYKSMLKDIGENICTIGFILGKYEKTPKLDKFISGMDKYLLIEDNDAIPSGIDVILQHRNERY